jgi:hypothetical protein
MTYPSTPDVPDVPDLHGERITRDRGPYGAFECCGVQGDHTICRRCGAMARCVAAPDPSKTPADWAEVYAVMRERSKDAVCRKHYRVMRLDGRW